MKKILAKITFFLIMAQVYLYGAFGEKLKNSIATEVNSTGDIVMGVIHILVGVFGGLMICFLAIAAKFKPELLKDNMKTIIWIAIITGVLWGVTNNGVSVFQ
ncbi:hypothetical protein LS66_009145 [Helicobacter sp. MIT 03-1614]|uniref:Uncharacterized protein n=3 Tax=Helicobacter typhlonius TaxID=76936 RepID=A0A099UDU8_9HELI|nr:MULTISPECIES: hypothetical protein [Helicobacter]TLD79423.1 hypothetical protein LS75_000310 [Helicobacter typhlonius]TLD85726.1 hypothetical protein LS67_009370 [Helicobacter sp. MIT 03-1616]TLD86704.1 hypothetical protein LS66_009145 [Helicobacter sp. MIT 03-1614]CUU39483.1 Hypothetical protein BN2458_PEG0597 [Helicobacter typhlonius]